MDKQAFKEYIKRIEQINPIIKKQDAEINADYKERDIHYTNLDGSQGDLKTEDNTISYIGVFFIDRVGNESYIEVAIDSEFLDEEDRRKGPSIQLFDSFAIFLDSGDVLTCLEYQDITKLSTDY